MAIIRELNKVENNKLHDAILLTTLVVLFSIKYQ